MGASLTCSRECKESNFCSQLGGKAEFMTNK